MRTTVWGTLALSLIGSLLGANVVQAQAACVAWVAGGTYTAGEVVTFNGATYTALVTQTDYVGTGWDPTIPTLYSPGGTCTGGTSSGSGSSGSGSGSSGSSSGSGSSGSSSGSSSSGSSSSGSGSSSSGSGPLPEHILVGYWQNFNNGAAVQTLAQVPTTYNLIEVAFANADSALDGGITFSVDSGLAAAVPGGYTADQFINDIQTLHSQHRFVLLSVGGQNGSFALTSATMAANFANSAFALMQQYGFDGIDIDMENVITSANYTNVETALRQLSSMIGPKLIVTMAPQTIDMLPSFPTLDNYLQIARDLGSIITMVNTQYYNSGTMPGRNGMNYNEGSVDFITAQADAVLQYLSPSQVGIGLPASPSAAGSGYVSPAVVNAALDCLTQGINCGSYQPVAKYPSLRGAMDWSTNWDASNGNNFSNTVAPHLAGLPK